MEKTFDHLILLQRQITIYQGSEYKQLLRDKDGYYVIRVIRIHHISFIFNSINYQIIRILNTPSVYNYIIFDFNA